MEKFSAAENFCVSKLNLCFNVVDNHYPIYIYTMLKFKFFNDKHFPIYRSYKLFTLHLNSLIVFVSSGTVVSLEVMNELLALLAHEGRGNRKASEHDQSQKVINWPPPGQVTPKRGTRKENEAEIEALKELESFQDEMRSSKQSCE